jgi:menaquinone-dependent protoporphyrinogen oxidase
MTRRVLVTYATTYGSTQEVAEAVSQVMRDMPFETDLKPAGEVKLLQEYHAVVIGAPMYMFRLHRDASSFFRRFEKELKGGLPVYIFAGGPFGEAVEKDWQGVRENLEKELAKFSWLKPASIKVIGGKFDPSALRFPYNLIPAMKKLPPSDLRNWEDIRKWASDIAMEISEKR